MPICRRTTLSLRVLTGRPQLSLLEIEDAPRPQLANTLLIRLTLSHHPACITLLRCAPLPVTAARGIQPPWPRNQNSAPTRSSSCVPTQMRRPSSRLTGIVFRSSTRKAPPRCFQRYASCNSLACRYQAAVSD
jgi:hypothetical protein